MSEPIGEYAVDEDHIGLDKHKGLLCGEDAALALSQLSLLFDQVQIHTE